MQFWRFVSNPRVSVEKLIEGWSEPTREAVVGQHVLAIQDTSELRFATTADDRRGLGKVKKGAAYGALLHAMIGIDADNGAMLGLVGGRIWTRQGDVATPHAERPLAEKELERWVATAKQARQVLAGAAMVTLVSDRESDFYANWALSPAANVHLLTRLMNDHAVVKGGTVRKALSHLPVAGRAVIELRERPDRRARTAHLALRFASMVLRRPRNTIEKGLPATIPVSVVQVVEPNPPKNAEPVDWILLTTHDVGTLEQAWRIVEWYRRRWIIEQFFRTMKQQGLRIEDSQLTTADRLCRLIAIAAKRRRHRHATRPGTRRPRCTARFSRLRSARDQAHRPSQSANPGQNPSPEKPPSSQLARLGGLGHRQTRRLARIRSQASWANHFLQRLDQIPRRREHPQDNCVDTLASYGEVARRHIRTLCESALSATENSRGKAIRHS